jgi:membrane carboxypeptidase/penicillin-binding protein PbpC
MSEMKPNVATNSAANHLRRWRQRLWRFTKWSTIIGLSLALLFTIIVAIAVFAYPMESYALDVGAVPLRIVDRNGELITEIPGEGPPCPASDGWTKLSDLPAVAVAAVIESEDQRFWDHHGVDPRGVLRAAYLNIRHRRAAFGGSTITQQLARLLISQGKPRGVANKMREAVVAFRLERAFDKRTILENWFGRAYFGNGAWGYGAAARQYFGRPPGALTTGEAVLLAVLPRSPVGYDLRHHLQRAIERRDYVLDLLVKRGILTAEVSAVAKAQLIQLATTADTSGHAPHFARWIKEELPENIARAGGVVHTSLDLSLQRILNERIASHVASLRSKNMQQAALVVLDAKTSEVIAMVGTADPNGPSPEINMAIRRRHPGSALKPFVYAAAIERGATPSTIAWDVRDAQDEYFAPTGGKEHGPTRFRMALAGSFNFAAVDVIANVGVGTVMSMLRRAGVAEANGSADDYGLRLALGAAKVRLVDLAAGYGFLVNQGEVRKVSAVRFVGESSRWTPAPTPVRSLVSPATAWQVMDMLADANARRPAFGLELPFDLPFAVAAKTGTARGFADTWAVAATEQVIVAAWAGTMDGQPMQSVAGMDGAAPLVRDALLAIAATQSLTLPTRPTAVQEVEVCAISGMTPGPQCPRTRDVQSVEHPAATTECTWHHDHTLTYPARANGWLTRTKAIGR